MASKEISIPKMDIDEGTNLFNKRAIIETITSEVKPR